MQNPTHLAQAILFSSLLARIIGFCSFLLAGELLLAHYLRRRGNWPSKKPPLGSLKILLSIGLSSHFGNVENRSFRWLFPEGMLLANAPPPRRGRPSSLSSTGTWVTWQQLHNSFLIPMCLERGEKLKARRKEKEKERGGGKKRGREGGRKELEETWRSVADEGEADQWGSLCGCK